MKSSSLGLRPALEALLHGPQETRDMAKAVLDNLAIETPSIGALDEMVVEVEPLVAPTVPPNTVIMDAVSLSILLLVSAVSAQFLY